MTQSPQYAQKYRVKDNRHAFCGAPGGRPVTCNIDTFRQIQLGDT